MDFVWIFSNYLISILISLFSRIDYVRDLTSFILTESGTTNQIYDYIVVGAGSAGAVIASRLSENSSNSVLVIEAGGFPIPLTQVLGLSFNLLLREEHDWSYKTVPQKYACRASENSIFVKKILKQVPWPRGKVLGGTSVLNFGLYIRGSPHDYNNWAKLTDDPSWSYDDLLPYFIKSIDYRGSRGHNRRQYFHPSLKPGPMVVESRRYAPLENIFFEAGIELGYSVIDPNGPQQTGFWFNDYTRKRGLRQDTYTAFLKPYMSYRDNLKISPYSLATKVEFDQSDVATGVTYVKHGQTIFAKARNEVVVSGGAIESPKLLMLSGIGPKEHLASLEIPSRIDLPVGQNLQDHVTLFLGPFVTTQRTLIPERDLLSILTEFLLTRAGPLEGSIPCGGQAFLHSSHQNQSISSGLDWPNFEFSFLPMSITKAGLSSFSKIFNVKEEVLEKYYGPTFGKFTFHVALTLVRPKSRGNIQLKDTDPKTHPRIDPKYLEDPQDFRAMREAIKIALGLVEGTQSFQRINAKLSNVPFPGCEAFPHWSDPYWDCLISMYSVNLHHPTGTVKMGKGKGDPTAVVDPQFRVIGTRNLRVADASIMPEIVNGNTNAPCIMIGEKAAESILNSNR